MEVESWATQTNFAVSSAVAACTVIIKRNKTVEHGGGESRQRAVSQAALPLSNPQTGSRWSQYMCVNERVME